MHDGSSKTSRSALPRAPPNFGNNTSVPTPNSAYSPHKLTPQSTPGLDATIQTYPRLGLDTQTPSQAVRVPPATSADPYANYGNEATSTPRNPTATSDRKQLWAPTEFAVGQDFTADKRAYTCARYWCCADIPKIGNMTPIWETRTSTGSRNLRCVVGPFWPVTLLITYPLIIVINSAVAILILGVHHIAVQIVFYFLFGVCVISLAFTACLDPGLLKRYSVRPPGVTGWTFSDQGNSYRPPQAYYCQPAAVVIEGYDHMCPWTGTAIGKGNIRWFWIFAISLNLLLYYNLFVIVYGLVLKYAYHE